MDIETSKIVTAFGESGSVKQNALNSIITKEQGVEILFLHQGNVYLPVVIGTVTLENYKLGRASVLQFSCYMDAKFSITEGDCVSFRYNGENKFYGYVFKTTQTGKSTISIFCYDQLRYLKNKSYMVYQNKKCSDLVKQIANANLLLTGEIEDTKYVIPDRMVDGEIFDIIINALQETKTKTGEEYILYDDFGRLCLKNRSSMFVPILLDESCIKNYIYTSSIDNDVFTKVTIVKDNSKTGERELYTANDREMQNKWGVLEYWQTQNSMEVAEIKTLVQTILNEKKQKKISITVETLFANEKIRAGSNFVVKLNVNNKTESYVMMVESVVHQFTGSVHNMTMDLVSIAVWEG